jgi:hypothetical protein
MLTGREIGTADKVAYNYQVSSSSIGIMSPENYVILEPLRRTFLAKDMQQTPM